MSMQYQIENKLMAAFSPTHLEVINESGNHNVAPGSESHFKVVIVSDEFDGQRLLSRHRAVNQILANELATSVHALALHTYTAHEWRSNFGTVPESPNCRGGMANVS